MAQLEPKHFFVQFRLSNKSQADIARAKVIRQWKESGTYPEHIRAAIDKEAKGEPSSTEQALLQQIQSQKNLLHQVLAILQSGKRVVVQTEEGHVDQPSTETLRDLSSMVNLSDVFKFGA